MSTILPSPIRLPLSWRDKTDLRIFYDQLTREIAGDPKAVSYTVSTVPDATQSGAGTIIYVSDETGGSVLAFSDGTDWRRVTDRAVIS